MIYLILHGVKHEKQLALIRYPEYCLLLIRDFCRTYGTLCIDCCKNDHELISVSKYFENCFLMHVLYVLYFSRHYHRSTPFDHFLVIGF